MGKNEVHPMGDTSGPYQVFSTDQRSNKNDSEGPFLSQEKEKPVTCHTMLELSASLKSDKPKI